ncbi:MAG: TIGR01777 family oxidoreductase [Polyangiales bacterium]
MGEAGKIVVTGASGLVGTALVPTLAANGFEVIRLVRRDPRADDEVRWNPGNGTIDASGLDGTVGAVHLAGDNVAEGRWTGTKKARIRDSRIDGTTLIANTLATLSPKPRVLVSASAIGFYGDRGDEVVDESTAAGTGFLASVCQDWEAATAPAEAAGIRVVHTRVGIVLAKEGGALAKMKTPFALGVGGRIGDGRQYMSWISLDDLVSGLLFAVQNASVRGPVNMVSPEPVTNAEFTETLGRTLKRPAVLPVPKFALRLALGSEMANEMLLGGARVLPSVLHDNGFAWEHTDLRSALEAAL